MTKETNKPTEEVTTYVSKKFSPLSPGKKRLMLGAIFLVVLLGIGWFLNQQGILSKMSQNAQQLWQEFLSLESPTVSSPTSQIPTAQVTITEQGFVPQTILIKKGSTVNWTNRDNKPHRVTSDPHPTHSVLPTLGEDNLLITGASYTYTFNKTGTFTYHDEQNPLKFKGVVIVK